MQHVTSATGTDWLVVARYLALGGTCLVIAGLGLANRVVIYRDWDDLAWSAAPALFAIGAIVLGMMLNGGARPGETSPAAIAVLLLSGAAICAALFMSLASAVRCNGWVIGLPVCVFKLAVALLIGVFVLLQVFGRRDGHGRPVAANFLLLGAVAGIAALLVNGERVAQHRLAQQYSRQPFPVLPGAPR